jgi:hypothetical protein
MSISCLNEMSQAGLVGRASYEPTASNFGWDCVAVCVYNGNFVRYDGRGNSKQAAKEDAARGILGRIAYSVCLKEKEETRLETGGFPRPEKWKYFSVHKK